MYVEWNDGGIKREGEKKVGEWYESLASKN